MSLLTILGIVFACFVILIVLFYALVGIVSFPFYLFGLIFKLVFFPISLIDTIFYPVGELPYLVLYGLLGYLAFDLILHLMKHFTSFKNH